MSTTPTPARATTRGLAAVVAASTVLAGAVLAGGTTAYAASAGHAAKASSSPSPSSSSSKAMSSSAAQASRWSSARYGAGYLARQIKANDGYLAPFGAPDVNNTAAGVLALRATHVGSAASKQAIAFLHSQVKSGYEGSDGKDDPGALAYSIMAAVSAGQNPRAFGGHKQVNNLVARLRATAHAKGKDKGLFGSADPTFDGAFRQGLSLAALKAAGLPKAKVATSLSWLERQQCSASGFWAAYRPNVKADCPKVDLTTFTGPDTNSTGMAAQGLAAYKLHPRKAKLVATFHKIQSADGGFPYLKKAGQESDPNSIATSIQGLRAYGARLDLKGFAKGGHTPYAALVGYQLGCDASSGDRGAFYAAFAPGEANALATIQAVPALTGKTFPLRKSKVVPWSPTLSCPAAAAASAAQASAAKASAAKASVAKTTAAKAALAGKAGACTGTTGVTVAVDFTGFTGGKVQVRCATGKPATGVAALQQAGFTPAGTTRYGLAFICRINSLPSTSSQACVTTPPATASWSYYHASHTAKTWTYSSLGASSYKPAQGSVEAWAFGNKAKPSKTPAQVRATKS